MNAVLEEAREENEDLRSVVNEELGSLEEIESDKEGVLPSEEDPETSYDNIVVVYRSDADLGAGPPYHAENLPEELMELADKLDAEIDIYTNVFGRGRILAENESFAGLNGTKVTENEVIGTVMPQYFLSNQEDIFDLEGYNEENTRVIG